jgi:3-dehydro-4-phosphotetronate decarboxylase
VPYFAPGDSALADAVKAKAVDHHAVLLANHGPVVSGVTLSDAQYATEELEETAHLYLTLRQERIRALTPMQVADLRRQMAARR